MKKFVASAATAGAIMAGAVSCANPEVEPQPRITTAMRPTTTTTEAPVVMTQEIVDQHHKNAINLRDERFEKFNNAMRNDGVSSLTYDQGNCLTFALPEGDAIVKNPAQIGSGAADSSVEFYLYVDAGEAGPQIAAGPYTYFHNELGGTALSDAETWLMDDVSNPELVFATGVETNGESSWISAEDSEGKPTLRLSETVIVPYLPDGTSDTDALTVQAGNLCEPSYIVTKD